MRISDWSSDVCSSDLMGYYISLSGIVTFRNADALRDVASKVPVDRLLVETDSPYLAPIPYRGKPNLPQYVREVAEFLAMLRGESYERFAEQPTENFKRRFPLPIAGPVQAEIPGKKNPGLGAGSGVRTFGVKKREHGPW